MRYFELMDTLFTRYCKQEDLFGYIEESYPYPGFKHYRMKAETSVRERGNLFTLDQIYEVFKELSLEKDALSSVEELIHLKEYEYKLEIENSIPIQCNIQLIQPEDKYLNNTPFTNEQLTPFFHKHGIPENSVVNDAESDTEIYNKEKTRAYAFTSTEVRLYDSPIVKHIRSFRLKNPHSEDSLAYKDYHEQSTFGLPIMALFCIQVKKKMREEHLTKALFCTNGLYQMFTRMYPEVECALFSTSSLLHVRPTPSYKEYAQKMYHDSSMIVDLHGFFCQEGYRYKEIFGCIPRVHVMVHETPCDFPSLSYCIESKGMDKDKESSLSNYIHSLSYDSRGDLFSMIEGVELRLHEKKSHSLDILQAFSFHLSNHVTDKDIDDLGLDIPRMVLDIIEHACST